MHSHYTLANQRAKDSVLAVAQPIVHGISIQHRGISISKEPSTVFVFHCCGSFEHMFWTVALLRTRLISCGFKSNDCQASYLG